MQGEKQRTKLTTLKFQDCNLDSARSWKPGKTSKILSMRLPPSTSQNMERLKNNTQHISNSLYPTHSCVYFFINLISILKTKQHSPKSQFIRTKCLIWWIAICHDNHSELTPFTTWKDHPGDVAINNKQVFYPFWWDLPKCLLLFATFFKTTSCKAKKHLTSDFYKRMRLKSPLPNKSLRISWRASAKSLQLKVLPGKQSKYRNASLESSIPLKS